ncbi:Hypothetical predicted protein [Lecanosticta acicola]|uniref:2EXR domain-containing protein n=1 Tax=Lecanosticta acicola TaxID=111012 RepID=A0AAI8YZX3_9PEZI|nr:Hypothetical predicted protein [Lecanosticta acicola]
MARAKKAPTQARGKKPQGPQEIESEPARQIKPKPEPHPQPEVQSAICTFMDKIPVEIRLMIYVHAFPGSFEISHYPAPVFHGSRLQIPKDNDTRGFPQSSREPPILRASREIRMEAMKEYGTFLKGEITRRKDELENQNKDLMVESRGYTRTYRMTRVACQHRVWYLRQELRRIVRLGYATAG